MATEKLYSILPCIACGAEVELIDKDYPQPWAATEFRTHGHYGSTFWDENGSRELVLNVCDPCLRAHADKLGVQHRSTLVYERESRILVGRTAPNSGPLMPYSSSEYPEDISVSAEQIGLPRSEDLPYYIQWNESAAEIKRFLLSKNSQKNQ